MKIVSKAAEDKKVENSDEFKRRLAFARNRLLMDSLLAQEGKAATTDEAEKKVYDDAAKQISGEQEVHARHILVETEDEAKAVKAELDKGADFAELAKKKSKGSRSLRRRRSRLLHQGSDGAGILCRRVRAGAGQDLRSREVAVRLAHHQGRGKAQPQAAGIRSGQEPRSRPM